MTNPIIPFTFIPGTKAKADEINQNFTSLAEKIDSVELNTSDKFNQITDTFETQFNDLNKSYSDINLSNNGLVSNCILEAPNGVAEYQNSTITIKSGLKLLIPNGKDEKSKLKSIVNTLTSDLNINVTDYGDCERTLFLTNSNTCIATLSQYYFVQNEEPQNPNSANYIWFNPKTNFLKQYNVATEKWDILYATKIGEVTTSSELVTELITQNPYYVLKQNDKNEICKWGFPSNKHINLTLGASGTKYIAQANGFFAWQYQVPEGYNSWYFNIDISRNNKKIYRKGYNGNEWWGTANIAPVLKGDEITIVYQAVVLDTGEFKFIYAQGESEE